MANSSSVIQESSSAPRQSAQGLAWLARPYYVGHFAALVVFPALRALALNWRQHSPVLSENSYLHVLDSLMEYETETAAMLAMMLFLRFIRRSTAEQFTNDFIAFGKTAAAAMLLSIDVRVFFWYLTLISCVAILLPQVPPYQGPSKLELMTAAELQEKVLDGSYPEMTWIIAATVTWSPACIALESMFARLSIKYTSDKLRFAKVDIGRWPSAATSLKVPADVFSPQLPSLILFEGSKERVRVPHVYKNGSVAKTKYTWAEVVKALDLNNRHKKSLKLQSKDDNSQKASGNTKKNR